MNGVVYEGDLKPLVDNVNVNSGCRSSEQGPGRFMKLAGGACEERVKTLPI